MINIDLGKYTITNDSLQYILAEKITVKGGKKEGEETTINQKYFPSLSGAFIALFEKGLKNSDATTLEEFKKDHMEALKWIKYNVNKLNEN